jgi:hypothetical protein
MIHRVLLYDILSLADKLGPTPDVFHVIPRASYTSVT